MSYLYRRSQYVLLREALFAWKWVLARRFKLKYLDRSLLQERHDRVLKEQAKSTQLVKRG